MEPIAIYRERVIRGLGVQRRTFRLFGDRVEVTSRWGGKTTEVSLPLAEFRAGPPAVVRLRLTVHKRAAIVVPLAFLVICGLLLVRSYWPGTADRVLLAGVAGASVFLVGGLLLVYGFRRPVEAAKFLGGDGKAILDVLRSGPDVPRFEEFVGQVAKQVKKARRE